MGVKINLVKIDKISRMSQTTKNYETIWLKITKIEKGPKLTPPIPKLYNLTGKLPHRKITFQEEDLTISQEDECTERQLHRKNISPEDHLTGDYHWKTIIRIMIRRL